MIGVHDRHYENVRWSLRPQIVKRNDVLVPQHLARRYLVTNDLAENAVVGARHVRGFISSKFNTEFGLGITPPMLDFIAKGTVVCTSGTAGAWSCTIFTALA